MKVFPSTLSGAVAAVPSKSQAHRAYICEFLAKAAGVVECDGSSDDIEATKACLRELSEQDFPLLRVGESGSTFRFLLPVVAALGIRTFFILEGRLNERPLSPLYEELKRNGCEMSPQGSRRFGIEGQLKSGIYTLDGGVSSQFISGLLFALPLLEGDSEIHLTGKLESASYIDMTVAMLELFGIEINTAENIFRIRGGQLYTAPDYVEVEGDWSNSAFWIGANAICGGGIDVTGLDYNSKQGDRAIMELIHKTDIDASDVPDLVPILAVVAAGRDGVTTIRNAGRLRIKESDRLFAITDVMTKMGADISETADGLVIKGGVPLKGGVSVCGHNDHRIVMSAAIAATLLCKEPVVIEKAEAVEKSYPHFFDDLIKLGGKAE